MRVDKMKPIVRQSSYSMFVFLTLGFKAYFPRQYKIHFCFQKQGRSDNPSTRALKPQYLEYYLIF